MHDTSYMGKKAGQSQVHAWFVCEPSCGHDPVLAVKRLQIFMKRCGPEAGWA